MEGSMKKPRLLRSRLYHALVCLLAAALAAAAVGVVDLLESRFAWRADMSFNSVTTQSEASRQALEGLICDVHAYMVHSQGNELEDLCALMDRFQAGSPHFSWSEESLSRNPLLLQWASDDVNDSAVTADCLILRCEETGRTRVLTWDDYVGFGYNAETGLYEFAGLTYEKALTDAILYVASREVPRVQLLYGHGELGQAETAVLEQKLRSANYETARVDLRRNEALDPDAPLMILSPAMDVTETELAALTAFVQAGGSLFVTVDFTSPDDLPNLYALYRLYGVEPLPGVVLADEADRASYYGSIAELTPQMLGASEAISPLVQAQADFIIMAPARALSLESARGVPFLLQYPVLQSGAGAYIRTAQGDSVDIARRADDPAGPFTLAVLCDRGFEEGAQSQAFFIGNSGMFLNEQIYSMTYSNELLQQVMRRLQGRSTIDVQIEARTAARPQLDARGQAAPVLLLVLPPLLIAVLAAAILLPRRYL